MSEADLPYCVEYAKSSRSSCKGCKSSIIKDSLRIGIMYQSPTFDGKVPNWHHFDCFFKKKQLKNVADMAHFNSLRWEDQKRIKDKVVSAESSGSKSDAVTEGDADISEFLTEYAKSSRSTCRACQKTITKKDVRIAKIDTESDNARRYGPQNAWHHVDCFVEKRRELGFNESGDKLPGFSLLSEEDKEILREKIKAAGGKRKLKVCDVPVKKPKVDAKEDKALKAQSKIIYGYRDQLQNHLTKKECQKLLEHNNQEVPPGETNLLDGLADCMTFGALEPCPECGNGQLKFKNDGYHCTGHMTGWTKCQYATKDPKRKKFSVPEELKEKYDFLNNYKYTKRVREFPTNLEPTSQKISTENSNLNSGKPLENFKIATMGKFAKPKDEIVKQIKGLGGKVVEKISDSVTCIISTKAEVENKGKKIIKAKSLNIHVVSEDFLDAVKNGGAALMLEQYKLCDWGGDPMEKIGANNEKLVKSESSYSKSVPQKMKVTVQGAAAVDPDSNLEDKAHVLEIKSDVFNVVLGMVDISKGTNSYYKMQILKSNREERYWVFRSWGRVGTTIGGKKTQKFSTQVEAVSEFKRLFEEKTGNAWEDRGSFVKHPGRFYPLDIDYGQDIDELQKVKQLKPGSNSVLAKAVQELICLIFDIETMKKAMVEFEIDLKKMPLGKLSKKQIESAYVILSELQKLIQSEANPTKLLDASNRFYTLIPHDFGLKKPPLLDNETIIKSKIDMLDSLLEIECAYKMLTEGDKSIEDPVDQHYAQLKTDINILDKTTKEYYNIEQYISNTHAGTHNLFTLELEEVFKINRHGESETYKVFEDTPNKKLLWHGSRITNFAGILSQGLRIAPPEAPVTGYMFGKGVYFADMVSKSANYCFTNKINPTGILLLCEVALGDMYERPHAEYVTKLPNGKLSTKGLGKTAPDPKASVFADDVEIPLGKPVKTDVKDSSLLYNEYIVYDVSQVNIKYLLKVRFDWKY